MRFRDPRDRGKREERREKERKPGNRDLIALKKRRRKETLKKRRRIKKPSTKESDTNNFARERERKRAVNTARYLEGFEDWCSLWIICMN